MRTRGVKGSYYYNIGDEDKLHCKFCSVEKNDHIQPLDVTGPVHMVAERWRRWKRSFQYAIIAKNIMDDGQAKARLLHQAGEGIRDIFEALESTFTVDEDTNVYEQSIEALDDYFKVATNLPYERHLFRDLLQTEGETVDHYVTRLRSQAKYCEFMDVDDQIRDQLRHGLRDDDLRQKLLKETSTSCRMAS